MMNQGKFYKLAIVGLLFLNVAVLAFFILGMPNKSNHPKRLGQDMRSHVTDLFKFSKEQEVTFEKLAEAHNQKLESIHEHQQKSLASYFKSLASSSNDTDVAGDLNDLQEIEKEKLEVTRQHFIDVKNLLNEDQTVHFQKFMDMVVNKIIAKNKKGPPPPKDF